MAVKPIPEGYPPVIPYLIVSDVRKLIAFLTTVFDAKEIGRFEGPGGDIGHAEMRIGPSVIMMGQANPKWPAAPNSILVYVEDTDAAYKRALEAGATSLSEPANQFYGDRSANVSDPFGNQWFISTRVEDVSEPEMTKRHQDYVEKQRAKTASQP